MSQEPVDSIDQVQSQGKMSTLYEDAKTQEANWEKLIHNKDAVHTYSCYLMVIEVINHIGLDKMDGSVIAESQLMDVQHQMQESMADIGKFIAELQSQEAGYHAFSTNDFIQRIFEGPGLLTPDTFLGLNSSYYNIGVDGTETFPKGSTFEKSLKKFEDRFNTNKEKWAQDIFDTCVGDYK